MTKVVSVVAVAVGVVIVLFGMFFLIGVLLSDTVRAGDIALAIGSFVVGGALIGISARRLTRSS